MRLPVPSIMVRPSAFMARTYACLFSRVLTFAELGLADADDGSEAMLKCSCLHAMRA
jgi:hypothetical protein